jgi:hypothetical protein
MNELGLRTEIGGSAPISVDLGKEGVEHPDLMAAPDELIHQEGADKSGSPCHQNAHEPPFSLKGEC